METLKRIAALLLRRELVWLRDHVRALGAGVQRLASALAIEAAANGGVKA